MTDEPDVAYVDITVDTSRITAALDRMAARLRFIRRTGLPPETVLAFPAGGEAGPAELDAAADAICGGHTQRVVLGTDTPEPEDATPADTTPCVHCDHPQPAHGRRYAAIPGWHNWTPERRPAPHPGAAWLPPVITNQP